MVRSGSGIRIFSPLSDIQPFSHRDGDTMLTVIRAMRQKISEIIAGHNTLNNHMRTVENGLEDKFNGLYESAATNVEVFTQQIDDKFSEVTGNIDTEFATKSSELDQQFTDLASTQQTAFDTKNAEVDATITAFEGTVNAALTTMQESADAASASAGTAATQATNAATSAAAAAAAAEDVASLTDSGVAALVDTPNSETRQSIMSYIQSAGIVWSHGEITPNGDANFPSLMIDDVPLLEYLASQLTTRGRMIKTSQQAITSGVWAKVIGFAAATGVHGVTVNEAAGTFTIQQAGYYDVTFYQRWEHYGSSSYVRRMGAITKNGLQPAADNSNTIAGNAATHEGWYAASSVAQDVYLSAGDVISGWVYTETDTTFNNVTTSPYPPWTYLAITKRPD